MKRFYDMVAVAEAGGGWQVTLDGRGVKTVQRKPQIVPHEDMAFALASEWRAQDDEIDPGSFRLRDMVDYAIDVVAPHPAGVAFKLVAYSDTDTLLYRAHPDEPLYARQQQVWEPILSAFEAREGVTLKRVSGVIHAPQDEAALEKLKLRLASLDAFCLAAVESMTSLAASLVVGLTALETDGDPRPLWRAAGLEEEWQAELWGRDEEAEDRRIRRELDFLFAHQLARLAQGDEWIAGSRPE
ncbi:ATP12 family chaperone protein [Erythrobacter sp. JK5]|uniref:ATP12 family chaperone protein n=1 Tax=Erythrobacter sp. JK5 TaxID=2829500 RepID=UPI001BAB5933|nr:ATP12 family protein [Erythrobacter sp. JK5]QUL36634.1 molecular chaperone [Erythrobacter sp. JK5]